MGMPFTMRGRVGRAYYLSHAILSTAVLVGSMLLCFGLGPVVSEDADSMLLLVVFLVWAWGMASATVRRLHDIDRPGWDALLLVVGNVALGTMLWMKRGTTGSNRYGEDPLLIQEDGPESLLDVASRYEMDGQWEKAIALYRIVRERWPDEQHSQYATNCVKRIEEKIANARGSTGTD